MKETSKTMSGGAWFAKGLRDGIPICMGYFAVSFTLGIAAREVGMTWFQAFLMSLGMVASAGEFAALTLIASGAGAVEMIATTIIVNLRYLLMSTALSQKLKSDIPIIHRFMTAYCVTDEIFGLSVAVDGYLNPVYTYGITLVSVAGWTCGTALGVLVGNILPDWASNAMSVSLGLQRHERVPVRHVPGHHHPPCQKEFLHRAAGRPVHGRQFSLLAPAGPVLDLVRL